MFKRQLVSIYRIAFLLVCPENISDYNFFYKNIKKIATFIIVCLLFMSCVSVKSLQGDFVPYGAVTVTSSTV